MNTCHICGELLPANTVSLSLPPERIERALKHIFKLINIETQRHGAEESFAYFAAMYILLNPPPQIHEGVI